MFVEENSAVLRKLALTLDYQKSWSWDNKPKSGKFDNELQIQKLQNGRDLGANIRYGRLRSTALFKSQEEQA